MWTLQEAPAAFALIIAARKRRSRGWLSSRTKNVSRGNESRTTRVVPFSLSKIITQRDNVTWEKWLRQRCDPANVGSRSRWGWGRDGFLLGSPAPGELEASWWSKHVESSLLRSWTPQEQHQVAVRSHLLNVDRLHEIQQSRPLGKQRDILFGWVEPGTGEGTMRQPMYVQNLGSIAANLDVRNPVAPHRGGHVVISSLYGSGWKGYPKQPTGKGKTHPPVVPLGFFLFDRGSWPWTRSSSVMWPPCRRSGRPWGVLSSL